ncbi:hypothetical protein BDV95DRAFT_610903 [Massariosphaeria phaeospora]|uniref:Uncharacterized protein n=1 Tax=Massariosphaeria phaeospora TaxID=100035 RepID=A0A7C8I0L1_9PLEO|nr:hypothetical protein BDV95DRAFT_610903 [Massariosphaeria phaeospora]
MSISENVSSKNPGTLKIKEQAVDRVTPKALFECSQLTNFTLFGSSRKLFHERYSESLHITDNRGIFRDLVDWLWKDFNVKKPHVRVKVQYREHNGQESYVPDWDSWGTKRADNPTDSDDSTDGESASPSGVEERMDDYFSMDEDSEMNEDSEGSYGSYGCGEC